jgi:TRAP-type C4-dicarboxylate transport system permease small subunit
MDRLTRVLSYVGIVFLMAMMLVSVIDVVGRTVLNSPLPGSYELVEFTLIGTVFFCLGHIQMVGGNISVEVLVDMLPKRAQNVVQLVTTVVATALFAYFSWASIQQAQDIARSGAASGVLNIPFAPFTFLLAMGYIVLTLVLVSDIFVCAGTLRGRGEALKSGAPMV